MQEPSRCPQCGSTIEPGMKFCPNCGFDVTGTTPPAAPVPSSPVPPPAIASGASTAQSKELLISTIGQRVSTDERLAIWWIFLPIIAVILAYVVGFFTLFFGNFAVGFAIMFGGMILAGVLMAILIYKLLNRRNEHMAREAALRRGLIDYFRARGADRGVEAQAAPYIQAMEAFDRESLINEKQQSALLWTILCFIPLINILAIILVLYWLNDFAPEHDRRFYGFAQNSSFAASQVGMGSLLPPAWKSISDRSFILYLLVTILISVFAIYWFYVLIKDLNEHFDNEWMFEDQLMAELQKS